MKIENHEPNPAAQKIKWSFCGFCGAKIFSQETAQHCGVCGEKLIDTVEKIAQEEKNHDKPIQRPKTDPFPLDQFYPPTRKVSYYGKIERPAQLETQTRQELELAEIKKRELLKKKFVTKK